MARKAPLLILFAKPGYSPGGFRDCFLHGSFVAILRGALFTFGSARSAVLIGKEGPGVTQG
jgi:hypothetical protein